MEVEATEITPQENITITMAIQPTTTTIWMVMALRIVLMISMTEQIIKAIILNRQSL